MDREETGKQRVQAELAALRARDKDIMDQSDLEKHQRRKAELKFMLKNNVNPAPQEPLFPSGMWKPVADAMTTIPSKPRGVFGPNFPTFTVPEEEDLTNFAGTLTFGTMMGFCSGYALKKVGRASATTIGVVFMALSAAEKSDWISVKWDNVERDVMGQVCVVAQTPFVSHRY